MDERRTVAGAYQKIESHEEICAVRYANINVTLEELKKLVMGVILGGGAFAAVTLFAVVLKAVKLA